MAIAMDKANTNNHSNWVLLVAEDDPDDQVLIADALNSLNEKVTLRFVENGNELLEYLSHDRETTPRPGLVLLDLNMPGKDGRTALREIKANPGYAQIPIVILTTSNAPEDRNFCQKFQVAGYYRKPSSFNELISILGHIVAEHR